MYDYMIYQIIYSLYTNNYTSNKMVIALLTFSLILEMNNMSRNVVLNFSVSIRFPHHPTTSHLLHKKD